MASGLLLTSLFLNRILELVKSVSFSSKETSWCGLK
jgi:hypothetical protein